MTAPEETAARPIRSETDLDSLVYSSDGLVTVVTQDAETGVVLMVAYADRDALSHTLSMSEMHYRSRRRGLWRKGETSGNTQRVVSLSRDCDGDAVLARVVPAGPACHEVMVSCFGKDAETADRASTLAATIESRASDEGSDNSSYTRKLLANENLRLKKLGEESAELIAACAQRDRERAVNEAADLFYHMLVALRSVGGDWKDVMKRLSDRAH